MKKPDWRLLGEGGLILLICGLAFGIHLGRLGFYWDDYASMFVWRTAGSGVFADWFGGQGRPLGGWLSGHLWDRFGADPLAWQGLNFGLYALSVWLVWQILRVLWPEGRAYALLMALLFAVYPSYHLRPVPIAFSLVASQVLALLSLYLSLWAAKREKSPRWAFIGAALIPFYPLIYEQHLGYEALRPLMLVYVFYAGGRPWGEAVKRAWAYWWPCLLGGGAFFLYRAFIFSPNPTYASYNQTDLSLSNLLITARLTLSSPSQMLLIDWLQTPYRLFLDLGGDIDFPALCGVLALLGLLAYVGMNQAGPAHQLPKGAWLLALGAWLGMMAVLLPVHLVGRALDESFNSRWALSPAPLAALILGLFIAWALPPRHSGVVLSVLIAWGVLIQVGVVGEYAQDWQRQQSLAEQVAWRAPELKAHTVVVLLDGDSFAFERQAFDYELTPLLAGQYPGPYPAIAGTEARALNALVLYEGPARIWGDFRGGGQIFRAWPFDPDSRLIWGHPGAEGGCWLMAETGQPWPASPALAPYAHYQTPASLLASPIPPDESFPAAAWEDWCFYYQRVQWGLQFGHWDYAGRLADEAQARGLLPDIYTRSHEWAPLVWAYYRQGRFEDGEALSRAFMAADSYSRAYLCEGLAQIPNPPLVPVCEL
jgi:hypothetical protein